MVGMVAEEVEAKEKEEVEAKEKEEVEAKETEKWRLNDACKS